MSAPDAPGGAVEGLFRLFVEDGADGARRLLDGLRGDPPAELAVTAYSLAMLAMLMGTEEIARLARACERGLIALAAAPADKEPLESALDEGAAALIAAFERLAHPDASGARVDAAPLDAARQTLEDALAKPEAAAAAPRPAAPSGPADDADRVWTPTVDDDMIDLFMEEATERLEGLSQKLLQLEARPDDVELLKEIFRDLHTIKGSSGMVGLKPMNKLAHAAEDLVGQLRDGAARADRPAVDALLAAIDGLRAILGLAAKRAPIDLDLAPLVARVRNPGGPIPVAAAASASPGAAPARAAETHAAAPAHTGAAPKQTLRVDFDKLDLLLNLVGELVLSKAGLSTGISGLSSLGHELEGDRRLARRVVGDHSTGPAGEKLRFLHEELGRVERVFREVAHDLDTSSGRLDRVSAELRDQVMKLRMVPIGGVFRKYHRTVRDLAHGLGKQIRLELSGEETELDKILVEQLDDPLMHLVRNSVDHGVETPAKRIAAGKDPEGTVKLTAYHRGNQIVIEISDDGGGIDPERLRAKAREKQLMSEEELSAMDDVEILDIIFRAGFSTAAKVTDVSGRGVGMDVVRDAIVSRLKGSVEVSSEVGKGSTFTLRLPLTLAIIQVLLARAAGEIFAIPLDVVSRTLTCAPGDIHRVYDREVLAIKGASPAAGQPPATDRQVPLIRLGEVLELDDAERGEGALHVVLVEIMGKTFGLICERLLGKQEIVIKRLGDLLEDVPCCAGATLLGDRCALILDVPAIVARATATGPRAAGVPAPARAPALPAGQRIRVLLVEDSETIRVSMQRMLEGAGYVVIPARDGVEALELAKTQPFDLVSTDVMMPNMDGYELTRALRADARHRDKPIIMVTSRGEKIDRVRGFDAGVDEYITKPHDRQDLLKAIARHLPRKS